ncbi:MAG: electron transport complex subunit RsxC [Clostridiaceae bacterium]|nr:electron transport complex subunit RsxC [Clostridiaceae bacterium]
MGLCEVITGKKKFHGGIAIPHCKNTAQCETIKMGVPEKVTIPMLQHVGEPCKVLVKKGDEVKVGQLIGASGKYVSAPIHSSVSGTVTDISKMVCMNGAYVDAVEIKTDGRQEIHESVKPPSYHNDAELLELIKGSGLVGLGGAAFPTHVKLSPPKEKVIDTLIVNGAECEPYITSDYREMVENSWNIISGIYILKDLLKAKQVLIGVEDNKPEAIKIMTNIANTSGKIDIIKLKTRYPQGAEKMLIYALTGRKVPSRRLPMDVGVIVMNVNSVSFVAEYVKTGMPLIKKRVTVDGPVVNNPSNVEVLIGTHLSDVFEFCGGFKEEPYKVIMGGPMMGVSQHSLENPVLKFTNAILAFDRKTAESVKKESPCIRCAKCVQVCPMNLLPLFLNASSIRRNTAGLKKYNVMDCIECGCCSYICPAKRHLVQSIRLGKVLLRKEES